MQQTWRDKIGNPAQWGGIETSVLDNGAGRGTRIAWVNTGAGLRYKVVPDRGLDIADAFYNAHSLAWISHAGVTAPQPFSHRGLDWLRTFGGGLLTTCGLSHVGGPEADAHGERGLHGLVSNLPADIESIVQPDPAAGRLDFSLTGKVRQTQVFGPHLELRRTVSGTLGEAVIRIEDTVTNRGNAPAPHMLLYHVNFGWPLADEGAELRWRGAWQSPGEKTEASIFREGQPFRRCPAPMTAPTLTRRSRRSGPPDRPLIPTHSERKTCHDGHCKIRRDRHRLRRERRMGRKGAHRKGPARAHARSRRDGRARPI